MLPKTPGTREARRVISAASVALAVGLVLAAVALRKLTHQNQALFHHEHLFVRIGTGLVIGGGLAAGNALIVSRLSFFARIRRLAHHAVEGIEPRWHTVGILALSAGVGEEIFFRGALEPVVGRWFTALGFVILHGAIRFRDRNSLAFAAFLYLASIGLSALNAWKGLEAAIAAHAGYDLAMLIWLAKGTALSQRSD